LPGLPLFLPAGPPPNLNTTAIYTQVSDPKRIEAIDRLALPLPTADEQIHDMASHQLERYKQSVVRLLGRVDPGEEMSRTSLSRALRSVCALILRRRLMNSRTRASWWWPPLDTGGHTAYVAAKVGEARCR
jgi:hypothetical protein